MPPAPTHTVADVQRAAERLWPISGAEGWDAPGLLAGRPGDAVSRILFAVDATIETAAEAVDAGAQLLLVHHPLLLRGVRSIAEDRGAGAVLGTLVRGGCALLAAHTNADVVARGTSAVLAERLGLTDARPIVRSDADPSIGLGRVGALPEPIPLGRFARLVADALPPTAGGVRVSGDYDAPVQRIALCGGAGDSLLAHDAVTASDVYVTADLRHHPASDARENARAGGGPALVDVSHWASEWVWLDVAADQLRDALPGVEIEVSDTRTDPWDFVIVQ